MKRSAGQRAPARPGPAALLTPALPLRTTLPMVHCVGRGDRARAGPRARTHPRLPEWRFCFRAEVKRSRGERRGLPGCGAALRPAASARRGWTRTGCPLWAPALTSPRYGLRWPGGPELSRFLPRRRLRWPWCWASPVSRPLLPPSSAARPDHGLAGPPRGPLGQPGRAELLVGRCAGGCLRTGGRVPAARARARADQAARLVFSCVSGSRVVMSSKGLSLHVL